MTYSFDDEDFSQIRSFVRHVLSLDTDGTVPGQAIQTPGCSKFDLNAAYSAKLALLTVLLRETIRYAELRAPGYRAHFERIGTSFRQLNSIADLQHFEVVDRPFFVQNYSTLFAEGCEIAGFKSTSGTSLGIRSQADNKTRRFVIPYTQEEVVFCNLMHSQGEQPSGPKPILLDLKYPARRIVDSNHGLSNQVIVLPVPVVLNSSRFNQDYDTFDYLFQLLFESFEIPGVERRATRLRAIPAFLLRIIAREALARDIDLRETDLLNIAAAGFLMSTTEQQWLMDTWGTTISTSLSCTESNGLAYRCPVNHEIYHSSASQFIEVLNPQSMQPVENGEDGLFVVTPLVPFQLALPFVRYHNGDVVVQRSGVCECGFAGQSIAFVGRVGRAIDLGPCLKHSITRRRFFGEAEACEILDRILGLPRGIQRNFRIDLIHGKDHPTEVTVTTEIMPGRSDDDLTRVKEKFGTLCQEIDPGWGKAVRDGSLAFRLLLRYPGDREDYFVVGT